MHAKDGGTHSKNILRKVFREDTNLGCGEHKNICVTGTIKEYKGKPEIIITGPRDISIEIEEIYKI